MTDWSSLIAAMRVQSGEPVESRMSDEMATLLDERFGIEIGDEKRTFVTPLPKVSFDDGLTDSEVEAVQARFGFRFPADLRALLQTALPVGERFPNWRENDEERLRDWLDGPALGICFDVEHNDFWDPHWGSRPEALEDAVRTCRELVARAPRLIPIYAHRFIPDEPVVAGNPVFSVHQTDIIHYGFELEDYLRHEFELGDRRPWPDEVRKIRFWEIERWQEIRWSDNGRAFWNP